MVRKYSGPLKGTRSAYVPGLGKKYRAASTIQRAYRKSRASRLMVSKGRYKVNRMVSKALSNYGENKFQGFRDICRKPVSKPAGNQPLSYVFYNTSNSIATLLPEYTIPMGLFKFEQGTQRSERTGDYMYIRSTSLNFEIQMLPTTGTTTDTSSAQPQVDFRLTLVKANRKFDALGKFKDPGNSLFLNTFNGEVGYDSTTLSTFELMKLPINKKNWLVYKDSRFTLNTPVVESQIAGQPDSVHNNAISTKNCKRNMRCSLPVWKKTHFQNSTDAELNVPDNLDTQWLMIIQACYTSHCYDENGEGPKNWRVNLLGNTTARDS